MQEDNIVQKREIEIVMGHGAGDMGVKLETGCPPAIAAKASEKDCRARNFLNSVMDEKKGDFATNLEYCRTNGGFQPFYTAYYFGNSGNNTEDKKRMNLLAKETQERCRICKEEHSR